MNVGQLGPYLVVSNGIQKYVYREGRLVSESCAAIGRPDDVVDMMVPWRHLKNHIKQDTNVSQIYDVETLSWSWIKGDAGKELETIIEDEVDEDE